MHAAATQTRQDNAGRPAGARRAARFRLFASYTCPSSHRVLVARALSGVQDQVEVVNVEPEMDAVGWRLGGDHLIDRYRDLRPDFVGWATPPLMVDLEVQRIVSNASGELMRQLGSERAGEGRALVPADRAAACDDWNRRLQREVNARVYEGGLVATAAQRRARTTALIGAFERLEAELPHRDYLIVEDRPLEPDWRLWVTLARCDLVYRPMLLSDVARPLSDYPNLHRLFESLRGFPGIAATLRPHEIVRHYTARIRDLAAPPSNESQLS